MDETHQPGLPGRQGLYDPQFEHDACGVGLVADLPTSTAAPATALSSRD